MRLLETFVRLIHNFENKNSLIHRWFLPFGASERMGLPNRPNGPHFISVCSNPNNHFVGHRTIP